MNEAKARELSSKIGQLQHVLETQGHPNPRQEAARRIAQKEGMNPDKMKSEIGAVFANAQHAPKPKEKPEKITSVLSAYREFVDSFNFVPTHTILAYWTGRDNPGAFSGALSMLRAEGYEFEPVKGGYEVVARPRKNKPERTYTESEVKTMIDGMRDQIIAKFGK